MKYLIKLIQWWGKLTASSDEKQAVKFLQYHLAKNELVFVESSFDEQTGYSRVQYLIGDISVVYTYKWGCGINELIDIGTREGTGLWTFYPMGVFVDNRYLSKFVFATLPLREKVKCPPRDEFYKRREERAKIINEALESK